MEDVVQTLYSQQRTQKGRTRPPRRFDQTQLRERSNGHQVNRDYLAHYLRWTTVKSVIHPGDRVLDIGCGQDLPLIKVLTHQLAHVPDLYVGVDLNPIPNATKCAWAQIHDQFNFVERWQELQQDPNWGLTGGIDDESIVGEPSPPVTFTRICCFEVIEHMGLADGEALLAGARELLAPDGVFFLSTPNFSGRAAVNHVYERTIAELAQQIQEVGLEVVHREGTFGDVKSLEKELSPEERWCWDRWKHRLGNDGLAVVFATLHPDQCKNNLWTLKRKNAA